MTDKSKAAKTLARELGQALKQSNQELPHSILLEIVAKTLGSRTWHAFQAQLEASKAPVPGHAPTQAPEEPWNPLHGFKSNAQFLADHGGSCPACGCGDVSGESFDVDDNVASQEIGCTECEAVWYANYQLTGYAMDREAAPRLYDKFVEMVVEWLETELGDDAQMEMDEVILDWCAAVRVPDLNNSADPTAQEGLIEDAETRASSINNGGLTAQVDFLWAELKTRKKMLEYLDEKLDVRLDTLKFKP